MKSPISAHAFKAALLVAVLAGPAAADTKNYEFQLVQHELKLGEALVAVRLVETRSGANVPEAVIFAKRIDMAPDDMPMMDSPIEQVPSNEPGVYRFKTTLTMAGGWQLSLAAKVQGEEGTVESKLILKAVK
jgi:hypothetical protein